MFIFMNIPHSRQLEAIIMFIFCTKLLIISIKFIITLIASIVLVSFYFGRQLAPPSGSNAAQSPATWHHLPGPPLANRLCHGRGLRMFTGILTDLCPSSKAQENWFFFKEPHSQELIINKSPTKICRTRITLYSTGWGHILFPDIILCEIAEFLDSHRKYMKSIWIILFKVLSV